MADLAPASGAAVSGAAGSTLTTPRGQQSRCCRSDNETRRRPRVRCHWISPRVEEPLRRSTYVAAFRSVAARARPQMVEGRIAFGETHLFVGRGYVVSVRHGASVSYAAVRQRCEACPTVLSQGEDYIVYAILDFIVDNYMPVVEKIQGEVEAIEDTVLATTLSHPDIERLYLLRRDLLRL